MKPGAVLFPTMYDMFVAMLESWKQEGEGEGEEGEEGEKRL